MENNPVDINKYGHGMRSQSKRASVAKYKANYSTLENTPEIQPSEADFDLMAFGNELDGNGIPHWMHIECTCGMEREIEVVNCLQ